MLGNNVNGWNNFKNNVIEGATHLLMSYSRNGEALIDYSDKVPPDIFREIFIKEIENLQNFALVNRKWSQIADSEELRKRIYPNGAFGTHRFMQIWPHINPGIEPPLPHCVYRDCKEGDLLTFITDSVEISDENGSVKKEIFNLPFMHELVKNPNSPHKTKFSTLHREIDEIKPSEKKHWVLLKQKAIGHGPSNVDGVADFLKTVTHAKNHFKLAKQQGKGANISGAIETVFSLLAKYFETGERYFTHADDLHRNLYTSVRLKEKIGEKIVFLNFLNHELFVNYNQGLANHVGFAVARKSIGM